MKHLQTMHPNRIAREQQQHELREQTEGGENGGPSRSLGSVLTSETPITVPEFAAVEHLCIKC